ncbi:hypothetical protein RDWZM_009800 [Blomia tropicalis]|uniref:RecF/RecN/SMC N-terminal domain-containing protein n=1 Tax=Blomia tropicalis TaxID=40697 RepID=A0A9Q0M243_BLOTA|nr:hypothetical protein RDWZM_009800 [Blomia tropicalis]
MHIVSITLSGFRSFRNETISDLSKGMNVLVGPNGVGKSNIILGLEFLFTRKYSRLDSNQRVELICNLNSNGNHNNLEASVSVIIDNSDQSIPEQGQNFTFKRIISAKKDQYFLNDRLIKFHEMMNLMEIGGFSPNSSFIIPQNLIYEIGIASPNKLLDIIRNLSGANSFDKKKITEEINTKTNEIDSINNYLKSYSILNMENISIEKKRKSIDIEEQSFIQKNSINKQPNEEFGNYKKITDKITECIPKLLSVSKSTVNEKNNYIYNSVKTNFEKIFRKLINNQGRVEMRLLPSSQQLISTVDDCVGIEILANFSNSDKFTKMQSLSSGQKTIISAALVFALQQIDSTPFFVFDGIDANLDKTWRESLSKMIKQLSKEKQIILSTFHPELCEQADNLFGIFNTEGVMFNS